jgi:hypothetical protein
MRVNQTQEFVIGWYTIGALTLDFAALRGSGPPQGFLAMSAVV